MMKPKAIQSTLLLVIATLMYVSSNLYGASISSGGTLFTIFRDTPIRQAPSPVSDVVRTLPNAGTKVIWVEADQAHPKWQKIKLPASSETIEGYIPEANLALEDPTQGTPVWTQTEGGGRNTAGIVIATAATRAFMDFDPSLHQYAKATNELETAAWLARLTVLEQAVAMNDINRRNQTVGLFPMPEQAAKAAELTNPSSSELLPGEIAKQNPLSLQRPQKSENELQKCMDFGDYPVEENEARQLSDLAAIAIIHRFGGLLLEPTAIIPGLEEASVTNAVTRIKQFQFEGINGLNQYLFMVTQNLASRSGRHAPYRLMVLNTEEVNAFSTPGGDIFLTKGLLELLRKQGNESQLAFIIGHEVKHITAKDGLDRWRETKMKLCLETMQELPPPALKDLRPSMKIALSTSCQGSLNLASAAPKLVQTMTEQFVNQISCKSYKPSAELLADQEGLRMTILAGYRPDYGNLFSLFETTKGFSNHPSYSVRKANLDVFFQSIKPQPESFGYHDWPFQAYSLVPFDQKQFAPLDSYNQLRKKYPASTPTLSYAMCSAP